MSKLSKYSFIVFNLLILGMIIYIFFILHNFCYQTLCEEIFLWLVDGTFDYYFLFIYIFIASVVLSGLFIFILLYSLLIIIIIINIFF